MLDDGNRELAQVTEVDDVIVSDQLISLVAAASRRGETAIGYRSGEQVVINPPKSERYTPRPGDRLIVLAES